MGGLRVRQRRAVPPDRDTAAPTAGTRQAAAATSAVRLNWRGWLLQRVSRRLALSRIAARLEGVLAQAAARSPA